MADFRQLLLKFKVREHERRAGKSIDRTTYLKIYRDVHREAERTRNRERMARVRAAEWLINELRREFRSRGQND